MKILSWPLSLYSLFAFSLGQGAENPDHHVAQHPVLVLHPDADRVERETFPYLETDGKTLHFDIYYPPGVDRARPQPAVIIFNGAGDRSNRQLKEWRSYRSWGRLMAASGLTAVMADARFEVIFEDQEAFFDYFLEEGSELGIDTSRLGLWAVSSNVRTAYPFAVEHPHIRAAAFYYGTSEEDKIREDLSLFLVLVGDDNRQRSTEMAQRLNRLAISSGNDLELHFYSQGHHAFDLVDDREETGRLIRRTLEFFHRTLETGKGVNWQAVSAPPGTGSLVRRAAAAWFAGDEAEVARLYSSYLENEPEDGLAHYRYAVALRERDPQEAKEHFKHSLRVGYSPQSNHHQLGLLALEQNQWQNALDHLGRSLDSGLNVDVLWRQPWNEARHTPEVKELLRSYPPEGEVTLVPRDEPGEALVLSGRLLSNRSGVPVAGALLYLYQTNAAGVYDPEEDEQRRHRYYGFVRTDQEGRFQVKTIRPGSYPGTNVPSHIHYVYFPDGGEPQDGEILFHDDPLLNQTHRSQARQRGWPVIQVREVDYPFTGWTTPRSHRGETSFGEAEVQIRIEKGDS